MNKEQSSPSKRAAVLKGLLILVFLISLGTNGYLGYQYYRLSQDPQHQAREEMQTIVAQVSQLMVLPEGEDPTIATVADTSKLKDQPFFAKAEVGDKVLLYTTSKKAILYRPSAKKIIEVAPINLGAAATQPTAPSQPADATAPADTGEQANP